MLMCEHVCVFVRAQDKRWRRRRRESAPLSARHFASCQCHCDPLPVATPSLTLPHSPSPSVWFHPSTFNRSAPLSFFFCGGKMNASFWATDPLVACSAWRWVSHFMFSSRLPYKYKQNVPPKKTCVWSFRGHDLRWLSFVFHSASTSHIHLSIITASSAQCHSYCAPHCLFFLVRLLECGTILHPTWKKNAGLKLCERVYVYKENRNQKYVCI